MTFWWRRALSDPYKNRGSHNLWEPRFLFFVLTQPMNIASPKEKNR